MSKKTHASNELVYRALKEAQEEGSEAVGLYATGEPFLNKKLEDFIKYAKEIGFKYVFVTTNGAAANTNLSAFEGKISSFWSHFPTSAKSCRDP